MTPPLINSPLLPDIDYPEKQVTEEPHTCLKSTSYMQHVHLTRHRRSTRNNHCNVIIEIIFVIIVNLRNLVSHRNLHLFSNKRA